MTQTVIECYTGKELMGGNRILIGHTTDTGDDHAILCDFGKDFILDQWYFEEFLRPRSGRIVWDLSALGLLPLPTGWLAGCYALEYLKFYAQEYAFRFHLPSLPLTPKVKYVLLSHGHQDHCGAIQYLSPTIGLVCSNDTHTLLRYYEEIYGVGSGFTRILSYRPPFQVSDTGSGARRTKDYDESPRQCIVPANGDWTTLPDTVFRIKAILTDHSIPGSTAFLIEDTQTAKRIVYTGDLRLHGLFSDRVAAFMTEARAFHPDVLITEATNVSRPLKKDYLASEQDVTARLTSLLQIYPDRCTWFECSPRDLSRIRSFYTTCCTTDRILVLQSKTYMLVKRALEAHFPEVADIELKRIRCFLPRRAWDIYDPRDYSPSPELLILGTDLTQGATDTSSASTGKKAPKYTSLNLDQSFFVRAETIGTDPVRYVIQLSPFEFAQWLDLEPTLSPIYIASSSEPSDVEEELQAERHDHWLDYFHVATDHRFRVHCSGHLLKKDLVRVITTIHPKTVIPIHGEDLTAFTILGLPPEIRIEVPSKLSWSYIIS